MQKVAAMTRMQELLIEVLALNPLIAPGLEKEILNLAPPGEGSPRAGRVQLRSTAK